MNIKGNIAVSESGFLFDTYTGETFTVNETGTRILNLLREGKTSEKIKEIILQEYNVDVESFEKYYIDFLETLKQYNLLSDESDEK